MHLVEVISVHPKECSWNIVRSEQDIPHKLFCGFLCFRIIRLARSERDAMALDFAWTLGEVVSIAVLVCGSCLALMETEPFSSWFHKDSPTESNQRISHSDGDPTTVDSDLILDC